MVELQIIKGMLSKDVFTKYFSMIKKDDAYKRHYDLLCSMHELKDGDIELDEYILLGKQRGLQNLDEMRDIKAGHETMSELIRIHSERSFCYQLGLVCMEAFEGRRSLSDVRDVYSKINGLDVPIGEEFVSGSLSDLYASVRRDGGLQWRLSWLNETIGGLKKGDFGFYFARTNVGKTTFGCSEVSNFLTQTENPIVWFNNEEGGARIKIRLVQSYFGISEEALKQNLDYYGDKFEEETNFVLKDSGVLHRKDVERIIKSLQPALIVVDSLDKIHGFKADRQDIAFGHVYQWARELSKEYAPLIGVCQAGSTAENKKWLDHKDIDSAHTAKSKEADFIIGIGKVNDLGMDSIRFLRQVKNKFMSGEHRKECMINYETARYEEI